MIFFDSIITMKEKFTFWLLRCITLFLSYSAQYTNLFIADKFLVGLGTVCMSKLLLLLF